MAEFNARVAKLCDQASLVIALAELCCYARRAKLRDQASPVIAIAELLKQAAAVLLRMELQKPAGVDKIFRHFAVDCC